LRIIYINSFIDNCATRRKNRDNLRTKCVRKNVQREHFPRHELEPFISWMLSFIIALQGQQHLYHPFNTSPCRESIARPIGKFPIRFLPRKLNRTARNQIANPFPSPDFPDGESSSIYSSATP